MASERYLEDALVRYLKDTQLRWLTLVNFEVTLFCQEIALPVQGLFKMSERHLQKDDYLATSWRYVFKLSKSHLSLVDLDWLIIRQLT